MDILRFTVPAVPPSVNMYVRHTRAGRHYVSAEALAFKKALGIFARGARLNAKAYEVEINIFLGPKQKGDLDNFCKVILDGLVDSEIIQSDAKIVTLILHKDRDVANPRTEIAIRCLQKPKSNA